MKASAGKINEWEAPELQRATVEWVWREIGPRPVGSGLGEWRGELARLVGRLGDGVSAEVVEGWMGNEKYKPVDARGKAPVREADDETLIAQMAADPGELEALLSGGEAEEEEEAREELARMVLEGRGLDAEQRAAVAGVLRSSDAAARAELLRKLITFVVPDIVGDGLRRVWEQRERAIRMPAGASVNVESCGVQLPGFPKIGAQVVVVREAGGGVYAVRLFARVASVQGRLLKYVQLLPVEELASPLVVRKLAVLESLLHTDRTCEGVRLSRVLRISEPGVHYIRKGLVSKVQQATGGRAGFAGLRNKPQSNKGRRREHKGTEETKVGNREGAESAEGEGRAA